MAAGLRTCDSTENGGMQNPECEYEGMRRTTNRTSLQYSTPAVGGHAMFGLGQVLVKWEAWTAALTFDISGITDKALTFLGVGCGSGKPRAQLDVFLEQSNQGIEYGVAVAITSTALETAVDFAVVLALDDEGRPRICFRFDGGMSRCLAAEQICGAGDMCPDGYHCMGKSVCVQCTADEHCRDREDGATTCKVFNRFTSLGNLTGLSKERGGDQTKGDTCLADSWTVKYGLRAVNMVGMVLSTPPSDAPNSDAISSAAVDGDGLKRALQLSLGSATADKPSSNFTISPRFLALVTNPSSTRLRLSSSSQQITGTGPSQSLSHSHLVWTGDGNF
eukprot:jgi/Tetstr1/431926/TSEL_021415.t1